MNFNFKTAISSIAPTLATMLGGPLAGTAVTALETALGLTPGAGADGVTAAVAAGMTPEQFSAVRAADQTHAERLKQMDIDVEKMNLDFETAQTVSDAGDRASARGMQIANHSLVPAVLSVIITVGFLALLSGLMLGWLTVNDSQALLVMLGSLGSAWGMVCAFWFGTTHDSFSKTQMIAQAGPVPPPSK